MLCAKMLAVEKALPGCLLGCRCTRFLCDSVAVTAAVGSDVFRKNIWAFLTRVHLSQTKSVYVMNTERVMVRNLC